MEGPRSPLAGELPGVIEFLNRNLRPNASWSINHEYPTAFHTNNIENIRIVTDPSTGVLSHAVVKPLIVKSPIGLIKVATIGSVVTDPNRRNQGMSQAVLADCLARAEQTGCDLAILWTDLFDFYRKLGFELAGSEITVTLDKPLTLPSVDLKFHTGANIDPQALLRLYNQHTVHSLRSAEEFRQFLRIPQSHVYTAWAKDGTLVAYAIEGKGADLAGYVHEWGGKLSALLPLFNYALEQRQAPIHIMLSNHSQNLLRHLTKQGYSPFAGYLGMVKIVNLGSLVAKIQKYSRAIGIGDFTMEAHGHEVTLGHSGRMYTLQDERQLVRLLFGPGAVKEVLDVDLDTEKLLNKILPLPLWFWGWDSI